MTVRGILARFADNERVNYVLTNHIPRRALTRFVGWLAKVEQPLVRDASIGLWRKFSDLDLSDARKSDFKSLHDIFVRELKDGARPVDQRRDILSSPCDAIVGAMGRIEDGTLLQVKGSAYPLDELLRDPALVERHRHAAYITLRLTASMYHRFHAPHDGRVTRLSHIAGDAWNVNPPTLARVPRVFCRNERAIIEMTLAEGAHEIALVPVAAILVAGIKLKFAELPADRRHTGPWSRPCDATFAKGQEMGWFEHGSTIIVLAPPSLTPTPGIETGRTIRMGEPLMRLA
jgi:phosphatidylserine decarboxylase